MRRLILVRHGETVDNVRRVAQGWSDSSLSKRGERQVRQLGERLMTLEPTALYSSTLPRAVSTARAISEITGLDPLFLDELKEMHCGEWEGISFERVREQNPELYAAWSRDPHLPCPSGESFHDVLIRFRRALARVEASGGGDCPVLVSHGTAIRIAATEILGLPLGTARQFAQDNAAINIFEFRPERVVLRTWNDATHCMDGAD